MSLQKVGIAGTLESGDVFIEVSPGKDGINIDLESTVKTQFGKYIEKVVKEVCSEFKLKDVNVKLQDKGALDCTIKARMITAIERAGGGEYEFK